MLKYIVKKLLIGCLTLFILATITFFGMKAMPGNPFSQDNRALSQEAYEALEAKYGLDKPVTEQYVIYMTNALHGDFGESISKRGQQVSDIIISRFPVTAKLGLVAFAIALVAGLIFGIVSALTKRRTTNNIITMIATMGVSIPGFLLAILMMIFFGVELGWLPVVGLDSWKHYIMPALALSFSSISMITRLTRSSLKDVMNKDYITLARSKGTKEVMVTVKHGLKNALLPVITYCGPMFAGLITGSLVIETLFSIPGIGREFTSSITNRDYTLVMGLTLFFGAIVIVMNIISDVVAAIIDPRIKLGK
ncbi:ABC transporter permease [Traorella massiliensis]|uniref:ABC transporter permease n=1 Tax=Traorella massiliensis TaxID=1903263 RepID=UPI002355BE81|nr:ABC transporter permease [Traorella massiliensis]